MEVGSRVQVPFGSRKVLGCVTGLAEESAHASLKPILKVIGAQTLVTPKILKLARWIGEYYCCAPETALKSVLPEAVRHEQANWRERLHVRALPVKGELPKLPKRQKEVWRILEERRELPLSELLDPGQDHGGNRPPPGRQGPGDDRGGDFRARPLRPRAHSAHPTAAAEPRASQRASGDQGGDGRREGGSPES